MTKYARNSYLSVQLFNSSCIKSNFDVIMFDVILRKPGKLLKVCRYDAGFTSKKLDFCHASKLRGDGYELLLEIL